MISGFMRISSAITILGVMREKQNYIFPKTKIQNFGLGPVSVTRIGVRKPGFGVRMPCVFPKTAVMPTLIHCMTLDRNGSTFCSILEWLVDGYQSVSTIGTLKGWRL